MIYNIWYWISDLIFNFKTYFITKSKTFVKNDYFSKIYTFDFLKKLKVQKVIFSFTKVSEN